MGLTTQGIAIQILASIQVQRAHPDQCTVNDCKVVVNHLIRKFSEPLRRDNAHLEMMSRRVANGEIDDTVRDHAVPVIVLMEQLFGREDTALEICRENVTSIVSWLRNSLLLVEITREEDALLSQSGLQRAMPREWWEEGNPLYDDPLARYRKTDIEVVPCIGGGAG